MKNTIHRTIRHLRLDDDGMTTAEYAVGTVAAAGIGGILIKILTSEEMRNALWMLFQGALAGFLGQ